MAQSLLFVRRGLKETHTKALLAELRYLRSRVSLFDNDGYIDPTENPLEEPLIYEKSRIEHLKKELATRPHIPNKKEARFIRQQKAKQGKRS